MKPTPTLLLAHQRLDAWRVCTELCREVHAVVKVMPRHGTKERRDLLERTALAAVRSVVDGANAYEAKEKVEHFAAARKAVGMVAAELEMLRQAGTLHTSEVHGAFELAARETAMLTGLLAKFGGLPGR